MTVDPSPDSLLSALLSLPTATLSTHLRNPQIVQPLSQTLASQTSPLTAFPPPPPTSLTTRVLLHELIAASATLKSTLSPPLLALYAAAFAPTNAALVSQTFESAFSADPFLLSSLIATGPHAFVSALEHRGKANAASTATGSQEDKLAVYARKIQPHLALATASPSVTDAYGKEELVLAALVRAYEEVLPTFVPATLAHLAPSQPPASTKEVLAYLSIRLTLLETTFALLDAAYLAPLPQAKGPAARAALASSLARALRPLLASDTKPGEVGLVNATLIGDLERFYGLRRRLELSGGASVETRDALGRVGKGGVAKWDGLELLRAAMEKAGVRRGKSTGAPSVETSGKGKEKASGPSDEDLRASLAIPTSAIMDVFPHLSTPYVHSLLLHSAFSSAASPAERVMEALLEGNLPAGLEEDKGVFVSSAPPTQPSTPAPPPPAAAPTPSPAQPTPPPAPAPAPTRANIFDAHSLSAAHLRRGKPAADNADRLLTDRSFLTDDVKAAIIARAEAPSSDEEDGEADTEAFVEDFDGAERVVRMGNRDGEGEEEGHGEHEGVHGADGPTVVVDPLANPITSAVAKMLEETYIADKEVFGRNSTVRRGKARAKLRERTGLADEQLEGWAVMLERNPKKDQILAKHDLVNSFKGNKAPTTAEEGVPAPAPVHQGQGQRGGGEGGRGRGGGQGGRGGRGGGEGARGGRGGAKKSDGGRAQHERRQRGADKKARAMGAL